MHFLSVSVQFVLTHPTDGGRRLAGRHGELQLVLGAVPVGGGDGARQGEGEQGEPDVADILRHLQCSNSTQAVQQETTLVRL